MRIGFVGLGKMGGNMVRRLLAGGHEVVAWAPSVQSVNEAVSDGAAGISASVRCVSSRASYSLFASGACGQKTLPGGSGFSSTPLAAWP